MRLLDTQTGLFHQVSNPMDVPYAVLSHRWDGPDREQSYQQVCAIQASYENPNTLRVILGYLGRALLHIMPQGNVKLRSAVSTTPLASLVLYLAILLSSCIQFILSYASCWAHPSVLDDHRLSRKIRDACAYARSDGHRYLWIDSCCIDKSSSSELSEAINAMYRWYEIAVVCYAYLSDVRSGRGEPDFDGFFRSQWHTRGWTLQELLAPDVVVFLSANWEYFGTKASLATILKLRLDIHPLVLTKFIPVRDICVAEVMSWAASRETTREEDRAYCLLGLFGVHMPTLYGEGNRAFVRLQEAIWTRKPDASVFAWNHTRVPKRIAELDKYDVDPSIGEGMTEYRSRVGRVETRRVDYLSHFAIHPADFLVGRTVASLTPSEYADYLGNPQFAVSGWSLPSSNGTPSPVPYIPVKTFLPAPAAPDKATSEETSSSLSKLYILPLPCTWRNRDSQEPDGLLGIVCTELARNSSHAGLSDGSLASLPLDSLRVLRPVALHDTDRKRSLQSSRLVLLTRADIAKCRAAIHPGGALFCDPHCRAPPRLTRLPPVRESNHVEEAERETTRATILLAEWTYRLLHARGYDISALDKLPPGTEKDNRPGPVLGYKLEKRGGGLTILVQHSAPLRRGYEMGLRLRIGLVQEGAKVVARTDAEGSPEDGALPPADTKDKGGSRPSIRTELKEDAPAIMKAEDREDSPAVTVPSEAKVDVPAIVDTESANDPSPTLTKEDGAPPSPSLEDGNDSLFIANIEGKIDAPSSVDAERKDGIRSRAPSNAEKKDDAAPSTLVSWTNWQIVEEGTGCPMDLRDPRDTDDRFFFRAMLRYQSRDAYTLGIELLTVTLRQRSAKDITVPESQRTVSASEA